MAATNLTANGDHSGFQQNSGASSLRNSILTGTITGSVILLTGSLDIAYSQLNGAVSKTTGTFACIGNYDASLTDVVCPP